MEVIKILRRWKHLFAKYRRRKRMGKLATIQGLIRSNPNLEAITIDKDRFILNLKGGLKFEWDPYIGFSCLGLAYNETYEELELKIIKSLISPQDTVFDIGANFGYFSIAIKQSCPTVKLYGFEPIIETFQLLKRNLQLNHISDVFIYQLGFSDRHEIATFYVPDQLGDAWASMGTVVSKELKQSLRAEKCEVTRLDDFMSENKITEIDFIKCDVEGAELLVVKGAKQTLLNYKPTLMLEIGDRWSAFFNYTRQDLIQLLISDFEYQCYGILNQSVIPIHRVEQVEKYDEDQLFNYFFVHPSRINDINLFEQYTNLEHR